jgi:MFS family permease
MKPNHEGNRLAFSALLAAFMVDFLGYAYIVPILPEWKSQFSLSSIEATALVSIWALPLLLFGPLSGRLTDKFGAGRVISVSIIMLIFSSMLYLVATEELLESTIPESGFWVLVAARFMHGVSGAAILTAGLAAASQLWPNNFGEMAGSLIGMATVGALLGPVIGGWAFEIDASSAFLILAGITFIALPMVLYASKDIGHGESSAGIEQIPIREFIAHPILLRIGLLIMFSALATGALEAGVPLLLSEPPMDMGPGKISLVLLVLVMIQGFGGWWWGRLVDRSEPTRWMIVGWTGVMIGLVAAGIISNQMDDKVGILLIVVMLSVFQFSVAAAQIPMLPMIDAATSRAYGRGSAGLAFGAFGTAWAAGTLIGPIFIGALHDATGEWSLSLGLLAIPGLLGLLMTLRNRSELRSCYNEEMVRRAMKVEESE